VLQVNVKLDGKELIQLLVLHVLLLKMLQITLLLMVIKKHVQLAKMEILVFVPPATLLLMQVLKISHIEILITLVILPVMY